MPGGRNACEKQEYYLGGEVWWGFQQKQVQPVLV